MLLFKFCVVRVQLVPCLADTFRPTRPSRQSVIVALQLAACRQALPAPKHNTIMQQCCSNLRLVAAAQRPAAGVVLPLRPSPSAAVCRRPSVSSSRGQPVRMANPNAHSRLIARFQGQTAQAPSQFEHLPYDCTEVCVCPTACGWTSCPAAVIGADHPFICAVCSCWTCTASNPTCCVTSQRPLIAWCPWRPWRATAPRPWLAAWRCSTCSRSRHCCTTARCSRTGAWTSPCASCPVHWRCWHR